MAKHKTFFGKIFGWIGDIFNNAKQDLLQVAIDVTNEVKNALNSGITDFITKLIPGTVDDKIVQVLKDKLPILLADELLIQQAGKATTEADAQDIAEKLLDSFGGLSDEKKEKFFTSIAAEIYIFLMKHVHGEKVTFGEAASLAESMYQTYLESKKDDTP